MKHKKIRSIRTHKETIKEIISLISKYTNAPHCPGTDHSWSIGINEDGEPDATCDALQSHFGATCIPVVFYDTTASGEIDLNGDDEMSSKEVFEYWVDEFMNKRPENFELLEFAD
jgi:hypothetical protein